MSEKPIVFVADVVTEELHAPGDGKLFGFMTYPAVTASDWALFCADATLEPAEST